MPPVTTEPPLPATDGRAVVALNGALAPAPQVPPEYRPRKSKDARAFWRAVRFLFPYRWMVVASITAAFFVGLALTGGLTTMLPIIRVVINGDTVPAWVDRQIAEKRLGVKLSDEPAAPIRIIRVDPGGAASKAGLHAGDEMPALPSL